MTPSGYVLYEDSYRVVIVTKRSKNRKTGRMLQVFVLLKLCNPVQAVQSGLDRRVCGNCPNRCGIGGHRACYVTICQAPLGIWRKWARGGYPKAGLEVAKGRFVRLCAYGDPAFMPRSLVEQLCQWSRGWTGYTHQWRMPRMQWAHDFLMASVHSAEEREEAKAMGWRTFRISPKGVAPILRKGEIICRAVTKGETCAECLMCCGTFAGQWRMADPVIEAHGTGARFVKCSA